MTHFDQTNDDNPVRRISHDVLLALRDGDEQAYITVYNCFVDSLKRFLTYLTGSVADGEEVLQEVFIKVWQYRDKIDPEKNIKSYLFTIAKNTAINYLRSNRHYEGLENGADLEAGDCYVADQAMIARDTELLINIAIENMPRQRREVFMMYQKGMSYDEIAQKLDITVPNVRKYVMRARNDIKEVMAIIVFFTLVQ